MQSTRTAVPVKRNDAQYRKLLESLPSGKLPALRESSRLEITTPESARLAIDHFMKVYREAGPGYRQIAFNLARVSKDLGMHLSSHRKLMLDFMPQRFRHTLQDERPLSRIPMSGKLTEFRLRTQGTTALDVKSHLPVLRDKLKDAMNWWNSEHPGRCFQLTNLRSDTRYHGGSHEVIVVGMTIKPIRIRKKLKQ